MAREIEVKVWCDVCLTAREERVPATYCKAVKIGTEPDALLCRVELCDADAEPFLQAEALAAKYGQPIKTPAAPDQPARVEGTRNPVYRPPSARAGSGGTCPACGVEKDTRSRLTNHARDHHGKSLDVLEQEAGLPISGRRGRYRKDAAAA